MALSTDKTGRLFQFIPLEVVIRTSIGEGWDTTTG